MNDAHARGARRPAPLVIAMLTLLAACNAPQEGQRSGRGGRWTAASTSADSAGPDGPTRTGGDGPLATDQGDAAALDQDLPGADLAAEDLATTAGCGKVSSQGCCDGQTLWWCASGKLESTSCSAKPKCGWNTLGFYDCNTSGADDPSGVFGKACGPLFGDAGPPPLDLGPSDAAGACGGVPLEGCCDGSLLKYCEDGVLKVLSCALNPACGWFAQGGYYDCGTPGDADPKGVYPRLCAGAAVADGPPDLAGDPGPTLDRGGVDGGDATGGGDGCGSCALSAAGPGGAWLPGLLVLLLALRRRACA